MLQDLERILFPEEAIVRAVDSLATRVTESFHGTEFTVVAVLKGSCIFAADLVRRLPLPMELGFAAAESYRTGTLPGELEITCFPREEEVRGREVLLVDDILDSGRTLDVLRRKLLGWGAARVRTCVLLDKPARRVVPLQADFRCFEIEDVFAVGYGLDFAGRYRNLPYVAELREEVYAAAGRVRTEARP